MRGLAAVIVLAGLALPVPALGQQTRAELLERQRSRKAAELKPYVPGRLERLMLHVEDGRLRRAISPYNGIFAQYGYTYRPVGAGIGFAGGFRHDVLGRRARVELEAGGTVRKYRGVRADFSFPRLAADRLEIGLEGTYWNHPQEDFYGSGAASRIEDRTTFRFKGRQLDARATLRPTAWLRAGLRAGTMRPLAGPGEDTRYPSIETTFNGSPGLHARPELTYGEGWAEIDYRDQPGNARAGGFYSARWRRYSDGAAGAHTFASTGILLQQFVPIFDRKRVFAFQAGFVGTDASAGSTVPIYLQPTVGGSRTVRSLPEFRLRDTHAVWLNAEYRWEAFSALDMAVFADAGTVAPSLRALGRTRLTPAYGIGLRVKTARTVLFRADVAAGGREGVQLFLKFSRAF